MFTYEHSSMQYDCYEKVMLFLGIVTIFSHIVILGLISCDQILTHFYIVDQGDDGYVHTYVSLVPSFEH